MGFGIRGQSFGYVARAWWAFNTHGHKVSFTGKIFKFEHYGVGKDGLLNYESILEQAKKFNPKLIVAEATA